VQFGGGLDLFTPLPFERLNETDVREEVIAPLLRQLGYRAGSENDVIREQSLRYPKRSLGLKNPKTDPELRGKADYILEVGRRLRWVIEAKAPEVLIDKNAIEQAWTYASHPEIRAIYFALSNGRTLTVFRTAHGPDSGAVLSLPYEEFDNRFQVIVNTLSPEALTLAFPDAQLDEGRPLAPGLRSLARVTNGVIRYEQNSLDHPLLNELQIWIADGAVERDKETGKLIAFVKSIVPSRTLQQLNEQLGLAQFEMVSDDTELSTDPARPTELSYQHTVIFPAGQELFNLALWQPMTLQQNITCDIKALARGVYRERVFSGVFATRYVSAFLLELTGSFEIHLA
jgi:hypothetical protein